MSFAKKFNKQKIFNVNTENFEYYSLEDMYESDDKVYVLRGLYINNKSIYEPAPVAATDEFYVNLPAHMLNDVKDILADKAAIADINRGIVGFKIYSYEQKRFNKTCYSVTWVDVKPTDDID